MPDDPTETPPETPDVPPVTPPEPTPPPVKGDDKPDELPPELKSVVEKERRAHRDAEKRAKAAEAELAKLKEAAMTEQEKAIKVARDEGLAEGRSLGDTRLIRAEVISAAAGKAADPGDIYALLSAAGALADIKVGDNGQVDTSAIAAAVDQLLEEKKHLAAVPTRDPQFGARTPTSPAVNSDAAMDNWLRQAAGRR